MVKKFLVMLFFMFSSIISLFACTNTNTAKVYDMNERLILINNITSFADVANVVSPAVVGVLCDTGSSESVGSGVCVSKGGYILTNSHVINGGKNITLYFFDNQTSSASILYEDTVLDIAILKSEKSLPYLNMKNTDELKVGEDVLAVGTPLSLTLTHTFTKGIISALNRTLKVSSSSGVGYMQNLIQHDASLNPGNSGGPILNEKGEVVGINTLKISGGEGIGFAIPIKSVSSLVKSFAENINYELPYIGVFGYDVEIANYYNKTGIDYGFYVEKVSNERATDGLMRGDIITKLNSLEIKNALDFRNSLYSCSANDVIEIEYVRDKVLLKTKIVLNKK